MALRIMVPEAGSYELTLTGSVAENSYAATFYTVAAPAESTMAEADVEAAMIDANKIDVTYVGNKLETISELATAKMTYNGIIHFSEGDIPLI
ncbi:MAG: hypothetical protein IIX35_05145, partial [Paraprevotella sp.]|nr:hypothetical protein [Paraprevotella sp.]